jgi:energy-coupling factor transporter transmembrane protein EcfT
MFALDAFGPHQSLWMQILSFIIQLVPAFIVLATVIIGWKWDLAGCLIYLVLASFYSFRTYRHPLWILAISVPLLVLSILFFISWYLKKKEKKHLNQG